MNKRTGILAAFLALVVLGSGITIFSNHSMQSGSVAVITQGGVILHRIDLEAVQESYVIPITDGTGGENHVLVEPGRICIEQANCPDQRCVQQGYRPGGTTPIVCLPHELIIELEGGDSLDAATG